MSRILKSGIIILGVIIEIVFVCALCLTISYFDREKPFENIIPDGSPYTYSVGSTEFEIELEYNDVLKLRKFLYRFTLIAETPNQIFNKGGFRDVLNVYMPNGEKYTITFLGHKEIMGFRVGVIDFNGEEYFVDYWEYEYGKLFCSPYHEKYLKWR